MGVHGNCPGLNVKIHSEGRALEEFPDTRNYPVDEGTLETRCYIQATDGAAWKAVYSFDADWEHDGYSRRIGTDVDGKYLDSVIANVKNIKPGYTRVSDANRSGHQHRIPYFNLLDIVEHSQADIKERNDEIGTIKVRVWRVISHGVGGGGGGGSPPEGFAGSVSEKAVKKGGAVSHGTGFAETGSQPGKSIWAPRLTYIDPKDKPEATFCFSYRSLKSLKDLRVIPRTPSPDPESDTDTSTDIEPEPEPDPQSMELPQLRDYIKYLQEKERLRKKVKDEDADAEPRRPNFLKRKAAGEDDDDVEFMGVKKRRKKGCRAGDTADRAIVIEDSDNDGHDDNAEDEDTIFID